MKNATIFLFIIVLLSTRSFGQSMKLVHPSEYGSPMILMIVQDSLMKPLIKDLESFENEARAGFLLINGTRSNPNEVRDSFNHYLNSNAKISKRFVYLVFVGDLDFFSYYDRFEDDFFANYYFISTNELPPQERNMKSSYLNEIVWDDLVKELNRTYRWPVFIDELQSRYVRYRYKNKGRFGIGVGTGPVILNPKNIDGFTPNLVTPFTVIVERRLNSRVSIHSSFNIASDIPKPQEIIQNELFGQIDIYDLIFGDGDPQEIELDIDVKGHVYGNVNLESRFHFLPKRKFQPYIGLGINLNGLVGFEASLDTTIILDPDSLDIGSGGFPFGGGGGGFGAGLDRDSLIDEFDPTRILHLGIPLSIGFKQNLGERWYLDFNARYTIDPLKFNGTKKALDSFGVNVGLVYSFRGKRRVYYDYVHLRENKL